MEISNTEKTKGSYFENEEFEKTIFACQRDPKIYMEHVCRNYQYLNMADNISNNSQNDSLRTLTCIELILKDNTSVHKSNPPKRKNFGSHLIMLNMGTSIFYIADCLNIFLVIWGPSPHCLTPTYLYILMLLNLTQCV